MDTRVYEYGNPDSSTVLLQMVDDHDLHPLFCFRWWMTMIWL